jgi:SDR family mycofactocin-dependent oxidoreductase
VPGATPATAAITSSKSREKDMGTLDGKVAFITGAGRGQGRSHAIRLAEEGADIIALDLCADAVETVGYPLATRDDLDETIARVQAKGRRAVQGVADVRDLAQVQAVVDDGIAQLGKIDIVCANAGIGTWAVAWEMTAQQWKDMIDVNLTGVFNAARAALPSMVERGEGGCVILTSSTAGLIGYANTAHYTAAKHGVIGLMKVLAQEAGLHGIRVNAICPTTVNTPLVINDATFQLFAPDLENPTADDVREPFASLNILPDVPWIEPSDVSEAVVWLASDAARYITGIALPIDAGNTVKKG